MPLSFCRNFEIRKTWFNQSNFMEGHLNLSFAEKNVITLILADTDIVIYLLIERIRNFHPFTLPRINLNDRMC